MDYIDLISAMDAELVAVDSLFQDLKIDWVHLYEGMCYLFELSRTIEFERHHVPVKSDSEGQILKIDSDSLSGVVAPKLGDCS